jgi:hypothetical protein
MKYLAIFLLMIARSAYADEEFYLGDSTAYVQPSSGPEKTLPPGEIRVPAGTYMEVKHGILIPQVALRISDTEVWLALSPDKETLSGEARQKLLSGAMVTLASGKRIQFFRSWVSPGSPHLLQYSPEGGLEQSIYLIPKKS